MQIHLIQKQFFTLKLNWKSCGLVHDTSVSFSKLEHGECLALCPYNPASQPHVPEARQILSMMREQDLGCKSVPSQA